MSNDLLLDIYNEIIKIYPLKIEIKNLKELSHLVLITQDYNLSLDYNIDIINGILENKKIMNIITKDNEIHKFNDYIRLYIRYLHNDSNPIINIDKFIFQILTYNKLNILCIKKIVLENGEIISAKYITNKLNDPFICKKLIKIIEKNHFYFSCFNVNNNYKLLSKELNRLIKTRDNYNELHIHLDNNGGGDLVPVHILIRCLAGLKEEWMKPIKKIRLNNKISEWDCWNEEDKNCNNYMVVKKLNIKQMPDFKTNKKYNGKIYLHMAKCNGSAAYFCIIYLIYLFVKEKNIIRYETESYGDIIKFGKLKKNNKLELIGFSGTTSGDGNAIDKKYKKIIIRCPTEQFIKSSVKNEDYNRYWTE